MNRSSDETGEAHDIDDVDDDDDDFLLTAATQPLVKRPTEKDTPQEEEDEGKGSIRHDDEEKAEDGLKRDDCGSDDTAMARSPVLFPEDEEEQGQEQGQEQELLKRLSREGVQVDGTGDMNAPLVVVDSDDDDVFDEEYHRGNTPHTRAGSNAAIDPMNAATQPLPVYRLPLQSRRLHSPRPTDESTGNSGDGNSNHGEASSQGTVTTQGALEMLLDVWDMAEDGDEGGKTIPRVHHPVAPAANNFLGPDNDGSRDGGKDGKDGAGDDDDDDDDFLSPRPALSRSQTSPAAIITIPESQEGPPGETLMPDSVSAGNNAGKRRWAGAVQLDGQPHGAPKRPKAMAATNTTGTLAGRRTSDAADAPIMADGAKVDRSLSRTTPLATAMMRRNPLLAMLGITGKPAEGAAVEKQSDNSSPSHTVQSEDCSTSTSSTSTTSSSSSAVASVFTFLRWGRKKDLTSSKGKRKHGGGDQNAAGLLNIVDDEGGFRFEAETAATTTTTTTATSSPSSHRPPSPATNSDHGGGLYALLKRSMSAPSSSSSSKSSSPSQPGRRGRAYDRSGNPQNNASERKCPFYKWITDTPITVDAFRYGSIPGCKAYFLSHYHADHYGGLTSKFKGRIYCSEITARCCEHLLNVPRELLVPLKMNTYIHIIDGIEVLLIDANHCPGAVLFLFRLPNGLHHLHTGDFRASKDMLSHPAVAGTRIHTLYLDTTYLNPRYHFPSQREVLNFVAQLVLKHQQRATGKLLVVSGTYTIGKEKVFMAAARALGCKIHASSRKKKVLRLLKDAEMEALFTDDPHEAQVHVTTMGTLSIDNLSRYYKEGYKLRHKFSHVLGFRPTGWTFSSKLPNLGLIRPTARGVVSIYGIPYSEHSSFTELRMFVKGTFPTRIIPTVNVHTQKSRNAMAQHTSKWMKEEREKRAKKKATRQDNKATPQPLPPSTSSS